MRFVLSPPVGYTVISFGGIPYYYHAGFYYRPYWYEDRWVYRVVTLPVGLTVVTLPTTPDRVVINGQVYYRDGSTYFVENTPAVVSSATGADSQMQTQSQSQSQAQFQPQYKVVKPPIGAIVETLPEGAVEQKSNNSRYFLADDIYYLPIQIGEKAQYVVVEKPNRETVKQ
ncbi:MAG: hypothetical protein JXM70_19690 [Pirellulales bacterium]|nr:hypothetical protein [Pirellulales bacterium]